MGSWKTCGIALGLVALNVPGGAFGQTGQPGAEVATFAGLAPQLPAGTTVVVTDTNGRRVKGKLTELTTESLTILTGSGGQTFARSTVREVQKQIPDSKLDGGLIGFAAGWGVPAAVCTGRSDSSETGSCVAGTLVFGGLPGLAIGMMIDAIHTRKVVVFEAAPRRTVSVTPVVAPGRIELQASVHW